MTVAKRLYLLIFLAGFGLASLAGLGLYQMDRVYEKTNFTNINVVPSLITLHDAFAAFSQMRTSTWQYLSTSDTVKQKELESEIAAEQSKIVASLNKYEKEDIADDKDAALLNIDRASLTEYTAMREKALATAASAGADAAREQLLANKVAIGKLIDAFEKHMKYNEVVGSNAASDASDTLKQATWQSMLVVLLTIALVASIGIMLSRSLLKQLGGEPNDAARVARKIADGDLTEVVTTKLGDDSSMMFAMKTMRNNLVQIVSDVRQGTDTIATASGEIASGNLDLSSRTEQQASSLEETASSMEELTSTVKQNADNARQANQLAVSASDVAVKGGAVVAQVVDTMNAINESAKKIVDIIGVIDGIAFQTNILALNAAVEAARAGEQGRGFAVVASEVRNLAQRSAAAAKEIKTLIGDSVGKVDAGSKLVDQAGATMEEVVSSVKRVSDIISEITAASAEQEAGISQINTAITEMDNVTQQNAALVEEAAAAAGSLQDQAEQLVDVVKAFKIDGAVATDFGRRTVHAAANPSGTPKVRRLSAVPRAPERKLIPIRSAVKAANAGEWEEF